VDRDPQNPQNIWDTLKDRGSFVEETLLALHRRNIRNEANITGMRASALSIPYCQTAWISVAGFVCLFVRS